MKRVKMKMLWTLLGVTIAIAAIAAAPDVEAPPAAGEPTLTALREAVNEVSQERENAIRELNAQFAVAPLDQRVRLEAELADVQKHFDELYLTSLIEYHRLSGNVTELERAERMLGALQGNALPAAELPLERHRTLSAPVIEQPREGVVSDEQ